MIEQQSCNSRCAFVSDMLGEDPIGTAALHERYILLELPLPWGKPFIESSHFPQQVKERVQSLQAAGHTFRFLVFYSDEQASPDGSSRLFCYTRPKGMFAEFDKQEFVVPDGRMADVMEALVKGDKLSEAYPAYEVKSRGVRELFVCTHGRHDVCCGKLGAPIYQSLQSNVVPKMDGCLRVWRVSHLGGHRMAPTLLDFPSGRYWGKVDEQHLEALLNTDEMMPQLEMQYRGWGGIGPMEQVVEREIWKQVGAKWTSYYKSGKVLKEKENGAEVRIEYRSPDGAVSGAYTATVEKTGELLMSGCGIEPFMRAQYKVDQLQHVSLVFS